MKKKKVKQQEEKEEKKTPQEETSQDQRYDSLINQIRKNFGENSIYVADDKHSLIKDLPVISTGSIGLNIATGIMGIPRGRIVEIFGPESSGKTTLALEIISQCQKKGDLAAFVDAEHSLDLEYAKSLGVKCDHLLISQPEYGEEALDIVEQLVSSGKCSLIVVDSIAALVPKTELEGKMGDQQMGLQARLMSKAMRKLVGICRKTNTTIVFINQIRMKIGVMWGSPHTTPGGEALKFYSTIRIKITRLKSISVAGEKVSSQVKVEVVKNKMAPPFRTAEFEIRFGEGIDKLGELVNISCSKNVIVQKGTSYYFQGDSLGRGVEGVKEKLKNNDDLRKKVKKELKKALNL